jgi:FkbM family methyltransferase
MRNEKLNLPNGLSVYYEGDKNSTLKLYPQILDYFTPEVAGILAQKNVTVFDAGANIGMFSMEVMRRTQGQAHIYGFEPIPQTFKLLQLNMQQFDPSEIHLFNVGLGQKEQSITFMHRPNFPMMSSSYEILDENARDMLLSMFLNDRLAKQNHYKIPWFFKYLPKAVIRQFVSIAYFLFGKTVGKAVPVECRLSTISKVIGEQNVEKIDLLKIDVEKAEMDVLLGIAERDWDKIKAIAMEVHGIDNRQEQIVKLLEQHGFDNIQIDKIVEDQQIFNMFASRKQ